jgi:hypothetical protein
MLKFCILFLFILFVFEVNAQNGLYILNLHNQNFEQFARSDTNAYINYYSIENTTLKPIFSKRKIAILKTLYLPAIKGTSAKLSVYTNQRLEIISLEDTCRIDFIDVSTAKKDTLFDLAFIAGYFKYYRNAKKRINEIYGKDLELANMANIYNDMLRGFYGNTIQMLMHHKIVEVNYAPLKPLYLKKNCRQDSLVKNNAPYYYLCSQNVKYSNNIISFKTNTKPKQLIGFDHYQFLYNNSSALKNEVYSNYEAIQADTFYKCLQTKKVHINSLPFTGFLDIAYSYVNAEKRNKFSREYIEQGITILQYQFKNGKLETVNITKDANLYTEPHRAVVEKPVLYLYPTTTQEINVQLQLTSHQITTSYPAYNNGWNVFASPDGTLVNKNTSKEHYCLYWETEGKSIANNLTKGFVVEGKHTDKFLEEKLALLGLNEREANEFIIYWLPQMENNVANAIYFATSEYEAESKLKITPTPIQTIRIMMLWQPVTNMNYTLEKQNITSLKREKGFVAVEWGGSKVTIFKGIMP